MLQNKVKHQCPVHQRSAVAVYSSAVDAQQILGTLHTNLAKFYQCWLLWHDVGSRWPHVIVCSLVCIRITWTLIVNKSLNARQRQFVWFNPFPLGQPHSYCLWKSHCKGNNSAQHFHMQKKKKVLPSPANHVISGSLLQTATSRTLTKPSDLGCCKQLKKLKGNSVKIFYTFLLMVCKSRLILLQWVCASVRESSVCVFLLL